MHLLRSIPGGRSLLALLLALSPTASLEAQWAPLAPAGAPTVTQGFQLFAGSGGNVHVFSAMTAAWRNLGAPYLDPMWNHLQTGDFVALLRIAYGTYRAYSARLDVYQDIAFTDAPTQMLVCVEDDVILMIGTRPNGIVEAWGFSGQTGAWSGIPVTAAVWDHACSRFVAGFVTTAPEAFGFSARYGTWVSTPCTAGGDLIADGNVLALNLAPTGAIYAFSGVLGQWTLSPAQSASSALAIDHNVAYIKVPGTGGIASRVCAYSAYTGVWETGLVAAGTVLLTDNVVFMELLASGAPRFHAFGARPGAWSSFSLAAGAIYVVSSGDDWVVVNDQGTSTAYAYGGLCGGAWASEAHGGGIAFLSGPKCLAAGKDAANTLHVFSATLGSWVPTIVNNGTLVLGACYAYVFNAGSRYACSARNGAWVAGPFKNPAHVYTQNFGGSVAEQYDTVTGELVLYHERHDAFVTMFLPVGSVPAVSRFRNTLLVNAVGTTGTVFGFSAQRGDLLPAVPGAAVVGAGADENVGWFLSSTNTLYGFGTTSATHSMFQYPLDTEFQVTTSGAMAAVPSKIMVRAPGYASALTAYAFAPLHPPIALPGLGCLAIDPAGIFYSVSSAIGANGISTAPLLLGATGAPICAQIWTQSLALFPLVFLECTAEPLRWY